MWHSMVRSMTIPCIRDGLFCIPGPRLILHMHFVMNSFIFLESERGKGDITCLEVGDHQLKVT
jgi:hypothetical protein